MSDCFSKYANSERVLVASFISELVNPVGNLQPVGQIEFGII